MFKVIHLIPLLAVLCIRTAISEDCLYTMKIWGGDDPTIFYYCDPANQTASVACEAGSGFVSNATVTGCIPWAEWSDDCISKTDVATITCEGDTCIQPIAAGDPSSFYLCLAENSSPVQVQCSTGRGFFSGDKYLGCYPWAMWRNITGCLNI